MSHINKHRCQRSLIANLPFPLLGWLFDDDMISRGGRHVNVMATPPPHHHHHYATGGHHGGVGGGGAPFNLYQAQATYASTVYNISPAAHSRTLPIHTSTSHQFQRTPTLDDKR
jgi:hypothetical protein